MWNGHHSRLALGSHGWAEPSVCSWFCFPASEAGILGWKIPLCDEAQLCLQWSVHSHISPPLTGWTWWEKKRKGAVEDWAGHGAHTAWLQSLWIRQVLQVKSQPEFFCSCVLSYSLKPIGCKNLEWTPKKSCAMRELHKIFVFQLPKEVWGGPRRLPCWKCSLLFYLTDKSSLQI